jgi:PAS domain S-box-containing protein
VTERLESSLTSRTPADQLTRLHAVTRALTAPIPPDEILDVILLQAIAGLEGDSGAAVTVGDDQRMYLVAAHGVSRDVVARHRELQPGTRMPVRDAIRLREPVCISSKDERDAQYPDLGATFGGQATVALPLVIDETVRAALVVSYMRPRPFDEEERAFITTLTEICALALGRAQPGLPLIGGGAIARIGVGEDGHIRTWNTGAQRLLGFAPAQAIGRPASMLIPAERLSDALRLLALATALRQPIADFAAERLDSYGNRVPVVESFRPARTVSGAAAGVDIVMRTRARRTTLPDERTVLAQLEDEAGDGVGTWTWDTHHGTGRWSRNLEAMLGVETHTFPHRIEAFLPLVHSDDRDRVGQAYGRAMHGIAACELQHRFAHGDGSVRRVRSVMWPGSAGEGAPARWIAGAYVDETDVLREEEASLDEQRATRTGTWTIDLASRTVTGSREYARIMGVDSEPRTRSLDVYIGTVHPDERELWGKAYVAASHGAAIRGLMAHVVGRDGRERFTTTDIDPILDEHARVTQLRGTTRDLTEEQALADLARERQTIEFLQRALLPEALPTVSGFELAARYLPAAEQGPIGGDWYDAFVLRDGRLAVAIGDVAGHGVRSSAAMAQLRHALRAYVFAGSPPGTALALLDQLVSSLAPDAFATAVVCTCTGDGHMVLARAGHTLPLLHTPTFTMLLDEGARPPLGAGPAPVAQTSFLLPPAATLVLYTDGLVERRDRGIDPGVTAIVRALTERSPASAEACCDLLLDASPTGGQPDDDLCLIALQRDA